MQGGLSSVKHVTLYWTGLIWLRFKVLYIVISLMYIKDKLIEVTGLILQKKRLNLKNDGKSKYFKEPNTAIS